MDLKIVCLLFACILSIALAQGEEETEEGGSEEGGAGKGGRGRGGRGPGGRGPRGRGGRNQRGGEGGEKRCPPIFLGLFKECEEFNKKLCQSFREKKQQKNLETCGGMGELDDSKRECMVRNLEIARNSFDTESFPECLDAVSKFINPKQ